MDERTLMDHLLELSRSLDEYRAATRKAEAHYRFEVEKLWDDQAELRDEVTGGLAALSNRIESLARGLTADPAQVAERMMRAQRRGHDLCETCRGSGEVSGEECPNCGGFGEVTKAAVRDADA